MPSTLLTNTILPRTLCAFIERATAWVSGATYMARRQRGLVVEAHAQLKILGSVLEEPPRLGAACTAKHGVHGPRALRDSGRRAVPRRDVRGDVGDVLLRRAPCGLGSAEQRTLTTSAASSSFEAVRLHSTTCAPPAASCCARARPRPCDPPVTRMRCGQLARDVLCRQPTTRAAGAACRALPQTRRFHTRSTTWGAKEPPLADHAAVSGGRA